MSRQDNSDPLPYVQVDRAVKPKAVLLANALGVSTQHALGSLVEWWELCGDPRELEAICATTPEGQEPAVLLQGDDASLRFKLASGRDVDPLVLVRLQLLEPKTDGRFRVRGMSRYFEPIERRIQAREAAAKGGKASAESRRKSSGTAQPVGGKGFEARSDAGSDVGSAVAQAEPKREPKRNRSDDRSGTEADPNPSGQRSAVSGQRASQEEALPPPIAAFEIIPPDMEAIEAWAKEDFWKAAELTRRARGFPPQKWPNPVSLGRWWVEARALCDVTTLARAFTRFADDPHWSTRTPPAPFAGFMTQWNKFLPLRPA